MSRGLARILLYSTSVFLCIVLLSCSSPEQTDIAGKILQARTSLRSQRYYEALTFLKGIDTAQPGSSEVSLMKGLSFYRLEDYRAAVQFFEAAQPQSLTLRIYIAYLYMLLGDAGKARELSDAFERQYGHNPEIFLLKGNLRLKEHAFSEARNHFYTTLAMDKSSVKAYIGLANSYLLERQFILAEENYLKAVFLANHDVDPYLALINYYMVMKRYDDAEQTAAMAARTFQENVNVFFTLSDLYERMGKDIEALEVLNKVLQESPHSYIVKFRIVRKLFKLKRLGDAYGLIQSILDKDPMGYYGLTLLGEYFLRKNNFEQAFLTFENLTKVVQDSYLINYYIGLIYLMKGKAWLATQFLEKSINNYPGFVQSYILLSYLALSSKKYTIASEYANLILHLEPGNVQAHILNGMSLYLQNHLREAQYEFETVELLDPKNPAVRFFKYLIAVDRKDIEDFKVFLSGLDLQSAEKLFWEFKLFKLGYQNKEEIEKKLAEYVRSAPNYLSFLLAGDFYKEQRNFVQAADFFQQAITAGGDMVISYYHLAEVEAQRGEKNVAIGYLEKAVVINPHFIKAYRALGSLYEEQKNYDAAKRIYHEGLKYAPEDSALLNNLAWMHLMYFGEKAEAYLLLRKALNLAPDDPDIQDSLGWWYYLNDDYHQAIAYLKKIVEVVPAQPLFRYHLGMAARKAGDERSAVVHLKKALELGIEEKYRAEILEAIK